MEIETPEQTDIVTLDNNLCQPANYCSGSEMDTQEFNQARINFLDYDFLQNYTMETKFEFMELFIDELKVSCSDLKSP